MLCATAAPQLHVGIGPALGFSLQLQQPGKPDPSDTAFDPACVGQMSVPAEALGLLRVDCPGAARLPPAFLPLRPRHLAPLPTPYLWE